MHAVINPISNFTEDVAYSSRTSRSDSPGQPIFQFQNSIEEPKAPNFSSKPDLIPKESSSHHRNEIRSPFIKEVISYSYI